MQIMSYLQEKTEFSTFSHLCRKRVKILNWSMKKTAKISCFVDKKRVISTGKGVCISDCELSTFMWIAFGEEYENLVNKLLWKS